MKILRLDVENIKKIKAVHIEPKGSTVILGGRNEQGKSSTMDAIMMALAGGRSIPTMPVREGAESGRVEIDLGDVIVTKTIRPDRKFSLSVEMKMADGGTAKISSAQAWLDAKIGELSFDPLEFLKKSPKDQAETLRALVGIDTTAIDADRAEAYQERTAVNRDVAALTAQVAAAPYWPDAPAAPVSTQAVNEELAQARASNEARRQIVREMENLQRNHEQSNARLRELTETALSRVSAAEAEIARLQAVVVAAKNEAQALTAQRRQEDITYEKDICELDRRLAMAPEVPEDPIIAKFQEVEQINNRVRDNVARQKLVNNLAKAKAQSEALTAEIQRLDREKAELIASAKFPVPGLGFSDAGLVTYQGIPLEQASGAQKIRVGMAVALAMNPKLKIVLVRDASLLDEDNMAIVAEMAEAAGAQVWLERVGTGDAGAVIIEDGEVAQ